MDGACFYRWVAPICPVGGTHVGVIHPKTTRGMRFERELLEPIRSRQVVAVFGSGTFQTNTRSQSLRMIRDRFPAEWNVNPLDDAWIVKNNVK